MKDEQLLAKFEDASLPLECFHHEEHVRVAFLYLCKYSVLEVLARFPAALRRYAAAHGKNGLYHETISWAFIFIIRERMGGSEAGLPRTWEMFRERNRDLLDGGKSMLAKYYRDETIASMAARERFVMPDRWMVAERP
jgi:hypothetical protein